MCVWWAILIGTTIGLTTFSQVWAKSCRVNGWSLKYNERQVVRWKENPEAFSGRQAHIRGTVTRIYSGNHRHQRFQVQIENSQETIEFVYNTTGGRILDLAPDLKVEACGEFIDARMPRKNPNGRDFPASEDGVIIHRLHEDKRKPGFLIVEEKVYGQRHS